MGVDKRIRELLDQVGIQDDHVLPIDRIGQSEATKISILQLTNYLSTRVGIQNAYTGVNNPDSILGVNGDFYYKIPTNNTSLALYQKIGSSWQLVFNVTFSGGGGSSLPEWIDFTLANMTMGGLRYDNVEWADYNPCLFKDGVQLYVDDDYDVIPSGGVQFRPGKAVLSGEVVRAVNFQTWLAAPPPTNGIVNDLDQEFNFTPAEQIL